MRNLIVLIVLLVPSFCNADALRVFVSVLPLKTFVEKIGGSHVAVQAMVRPGFDPHTYDPTPQQISALSKSALYVRIGVPFEAIWMKRIRSVNPQMQVVDARAGIDLQNLEHHDGDEAAHPPSHFNGETAAHDPHVWTSPPLVKRIARNIRDALTGLDSAHGQDYARNYTVFVSELDQLDRDILALLKDLPNRKFMVFHPAWGYFADTYGLIQVPIEYEGKEPGARTLTALIEQAKREQVKIIFVQPQFNKQSALQLAGAIGGRVVAIDPLSAEYESNLRRVAREIAGAVQP